MKMGGNSFDLIMQEVLSQKQRMEELREENLALRRQLNDLRNGRGIFLEIYGKKFALPGDAVVASSQVDSPLQHAPALYAETISTPLDETPTHTVIETPLPSTDEFEQVGDYLAHEEEALPKQASTSLEEMLIDEFASATTSQMAAATWEGAESSKAATIEEEEKAALRKELIGSFLLE
jgi:hypothetical protein